MNPRIQCDRTRKGIINSAQTRGTDRRSHKEGAVEGPVGPHADATSGCDPAFVTPALQYRRLIIIERTWPHRHHHPAWFVLRQSPLIPITLMIKLQNFRSVFVSVSVPEL